MFALVALIDSDREGVRKAAGRFQEAVAERQDPCGFALGLTRCSTVLNRTGVRDALRGDVQVLEIEEDSTTYAAVLIGRRVTIWTLFDRDWRLIELCRRDEILVHESFGCGPVVPA